VVDVLLHITVAITIIIMEETTVAITMGLLKITGTTINEEL